MKKICILFVAVFSFMATKAQEKTESVEVKNGAWGRDFYYNGNKISYDQFKEMAKDNQEIISNVSKGRTKQNIAQVLSFAGGFGVGWVLGDLIAGRPFNAGVTTVSLGLIGIAIPLDISAKNNFKKAAENFNQNKPKSAFNPEMNLVVNTNGAGIQLKF